MHFGTLASIKSKNKDFIILIKTSGNKWRRNYGSSVKLVFLNVFSFWNAKYIVCSLLLKIYLTSLEEIIILCRCFLGEKQEDWLLHRT